MQLSSSFTFVQLLAAVSAITITSPARDSSSTRPVVYNNGTITITWSTVSSDPTQINIQLSTNNGQSTSTIAENIASSADQYVVDLSKLAPGSNYAVNLAGASSSGNTGILAQSGTFTVEQGEVASSSSSTMAAASTAAPSSAASGVAGGSAMSTRSELSGSAVPSASAGAGASVSGSPIIAPVPVASGASASGASAGSAATSAAASAATSAAASGASSAAATGARASRSGAASSGASAAPSTTGASQTKSDAGKVMASLTVAGLVAVFGLLV